MKRYFYRRSAFACRSARARPALFANLPETGQGNADFRTAKRRKRFFRAFTRIWRTSTPIRTTCRCCSQISTDIAQCEGSSDDPVPREIPTNSHTASTSQISRTWQQLYSAIYDANDHRDRFDRMDGWGARTANWPPSGRGPGAACAVLFSNWCAGDGNVVLMTSTADSRKKDEYSPPRKRMSTPISKRT